MVAQRVNPQKEHFPPLDLDGELISLEDALRKYHGEAILVRINEEDARREPAHARVVAHSFDHDAMTRMVDHEPVRSQLWADDPRDYFIIHTEPDHQAADDERYVRWLTGFVRRPKDRRV